MRGLILKIHLALALIAGAFMVLLGVTGSIMAFEPELDRLFHPGLSYVTPRGRALSLVEIGEAVSRKYGGEPIVAYLPSTSPSFPTEVILSRGIVSVNQYTAEVLGVRTRGQTALGVVRSLHVRLASGDLGRNILRWADVSILFSLASGLFLWWPGKQLRIRGSWWSRRFWFDLHNSFGIFSLLPLLALATTGAVLGFEDQVSSLLDQVYGANPIHLSETRARSKPEAGSIAITPDQAVEVACARLPGAVAYRVQMPRYGGEYVVALTYSQDRMLGGNNSISIDPWNGNILSANLSTVLTPRERFLSMNEAIHTGNLFGTPSRIIVALAGVLLPVQAVSGLLIWLHRSKIMQKNRSVMDSRV